MALGSVNVPGDVGPTASAVTPKPPGTASVGTDTGFSRGDHVHPAQTSVSGNAGTATKMANSRNIDGVGFDGSKSITHYGTCTTFANTTEKVVACPGFSLVTGARITVVFKYETAAAKPTLNVNSTGAKPIRYNTNINIDYIGIWRAGTAIDFIYDGTYWLMIHPSFVEGNSYASGAYAHSEGYGTQASNIASHVQGKFNKEMTSGGTLADLVGDAMAVGNGQELSGGSLRSNAFRITYAGEVYGCSEFKTTGADYAEYFEWADGNPGEQDRVGYFVTLDGKYIRRANPDDYILGIVSGQPCIIGNADEDWLGRWEHDEFGRFVKEYLMATGEMDEDGNPIFAVVDHITPSWRYKANPDYNPDQPYIERKNRPEWSAVGMLGVLSVQDDGSCQAGGYCQVARGGIAVAADGEFFFADGKIVKGYRVIERVSKNVVKVVFR